MSQPPSQGVIYAATGEPYLETARRSVRSLRKHAPDVHVTLFSDIDDTSGLFDRVVLLSDAHARSKVDAICDTPYDRTLFLDADTIIRSDIRPMFALLDRFDICIAGVVLWHRKTHQKRYRAKIPDCFVEPNTGVVLFRRDGAMERFLADYRAAFHDLGSSNDQITMRELLWTSDVRYYVLPPQYNKRVFEASELIWSDQPKPRILHLEFLRPTRNRLKAWLADRLA